MNNKRFSKGSLFCLGCLLLLATSFALLFCEYFFEFIIAFPVLFLAIVLIWRNHSVVKKITLPLILEQKQPHPVRFFALYFCVVFSLSMVFWGAYFPGGFNLDAYGQWDQAHGILPYNDWHPLFSTLIIQCVISLFDSFEFYIFLQILCFSVAVASLLKCLQDHGVAPKWLTLISVFVGLNPAIGLNTICLTKDVQFTILIVLLYICLIQIYCSNGKWLRSWVHIAILSCLSASAMLVRHNGLLFIAPAILLLFLYYKKAWLHNLITVLLVACIVLIVKGPVAQKLNVEHHDNVIGESVGIPMAILVNALVSDPENIPHEAHQFLNKIASDEEWKTNYYVGEWDSCKWDFGGTELLKDESFTRIIDLTLKTVIACPQSSYESFRANTQIVWNPLIPNADWVPEEYIAENDVGIISNTIPALHSLIEFLKPLSIVPIVGAVFWNTGFQMSLILICYCVVYRSVTRRIRLFFLPLLLYNLGTMLLLAGPNQRYFFCNAVVFLPILLLMLLKKNIESVS